MLTDAIRFAGKTVEALLPNLEINIINTYFFCKVLRLIAKRIWPVTDLLLRLLKYGKRKVSKQKKDNIDCYLKRVIDDLQRVMKATYIAVIAFCLQHI